MTLHTNGLRQLLMQELHKTAISGHLGAPKLAHTLFQRAWWPELRQWAAHFIPSIQFALELSILQQSHLVCATFANPMKMFLKLLH